MKVIMLSGPSNSGKTTVINEVYKILTGNYFYPDNRHKDFECTIQYNGLVIALKSQGDCACDPIGAMQQYATSNINILICAHNINKKTPLKEIQKHKHVIISKTAPYKEQTTCLLDADKIIRNI